MCSTTEVIFAVVGGDTSDTSCGTTVIKELQREYILHSVGLNQIDGGFDIPIWSLGIIQKYHQHTMELAWMF